MRNRQILAHIGMVWDDEGSLDLLGAMDIPVLAVHGTESTRQDIAIVKALSTLVPQVTLLELPGDHACHLENMDAFLEALETHIAGAKPHAEGSRPSRDDLLARRQE
jgi:pimeloyl-ACP methyl ester carboxylesterase